MKNGIMVSNLHYAVIVFILVFSLNTYASQNDDLVMYYNFDSETDVVVVDKSGNGNHGKIHGNVKRIDIACGQAIEFNGKGSYLECDANKVLNINSSGTVMVWVYPESPQGGIMSWNTGDGWNDLRFALSFDTYNDRCRFIGCMSDENASSIFLDAPSLNLHEWMHYAITFDGKSVGVYKNGLLEASVAQGVMPEIKGIPLWIGRCRGLGKEYFKGMMDEVRIYNRALSSQEILTIYKQDAQHREHDLRCFNKPKLKVDIYPDAGNIVVIMDSRLMQPLPSNTKITIDICLPDTKDPILQKTVIHERDTPTDLIFDGKTLQAGNYDVRARIIGPNNSLIGEEAISNLYWKGQSEAFRNSKVLNNFVWELLNVRGNDDSTIPGQYTINNPCERWVYIKSTAHIGKNSNLWISVDSKSKEDAILIHAKEGESVLEAMRFLSSGKHSLFIQCKGDARLKEIVARSIPSLQYAFYDAQPHIYPYGPYDWEFLSKDILPNINEMISSSKTEPPHLKEWKMSGRRWISITDVPKVKNNIFQYWSGNIGFQHPSMDGVIVDEFVGGNEPVYDLYHEAVARIFSNPIFKGKRFMPYFGGTFTGSGRSTEFARLCFHGCGNICWERYLPEQPTQEMANAFIREKLLHELSVWENAIPGITQRVIMVLGCMSQPTESLNVDPTVDFKVFMDMQIRFLATHPAFFGLGGLQEYHASYCDEENLRWIGKLYRHYCIEGNRTPLAEDPYELTHIQNPDFRKGLSSWKIYPAEEGTIRQIEYDGYSWLQGRYPRTNRGDTFLWTKRSDKRPNVFRQEIKDLTPGRLYSLKMITGDYQDLIHERSVEGNHAISILFDNAEVLSGVKNAFQYAFPNNYAHTLGKFNRDYPYYMNYHWRVFRAKGTMAKLIVKDWKNNRESGGPVGQELMYNFIEIEPYLDE